jgi:hypothetical protein
MTTPAPPAAITSPNSSSRTAVPYRSTARITAGEAWLGETPFYPPEASPRPVVQAPRARAARVAPGQANQGRASQRPVPES